MRAHACPGRQPLRVACMLCRSAPAAGPHLVLRRCPPATCPPVCLQGRPRAAAGRREHHRRRHLQLWRVPLRNPDRGAAGPRTAAHASSPVRVPPGKHLPSAVIPRGVPPRRRSSPTEDGSAACTDLGCSLGACAAERHATHLRRHSAPFPSSLQEVADLFVRCTSSNPQARPTAEELVRCLSELV